MLCLVLQIQCIRTLREAGCRLDAKNNCGLTANDIFYAVVAIDESWRSFLSTPYEGTLSSSSRLQTTALCLGTLESDALLSKHHAHWLTSPQTSLNLVEQQFKAEKNAYMRLRLFSDGREKGKFTDTEFPSDDSSIFTDENNPTVGVLGRPQMWQRLDEIYLNLSLEIAASSIQQEANIIQGEVGDCYFMSDLSIVLGGTLSPEQLLIGNFSAGVCAVLLTSTLNLTLTLTPTLTLTLLCRGISRSVLHVREVEMVYGR